MNKIRFAVGDRFIEFHPETHADTVGTIDGFLRLMKGAGFAGAVEMCIAESKKHEGFVPAISEVAKTS